MHNKHNPTDSVQSPEQAPSMLKSLCGNNGYDKILPEAEEAVAHAKGKWEAVFKNGLTGEIGIRNEGGFICWLQHLDRYPDQEERYEREALERVATAHLIANAPKTLRQRGMLLEACKRLLAIAKLCDSPDVFTTSARELLRAEVKQAEAAIKECEESK